MTGICKPTSWFRLPCVLQVLASTQPCGAPNVGRSPASLMDVLFSYSEVSVSTSVRECARPAHACLGAPVVDAPCGHAHRLVKHLEQFLLLREGTKFDAGRAHSSTVFLQWRLDGPRGAAGATVRRIGRTCDRHLILTVRAENFPLRVPNLCPRWQFDEPRLFQRTRRSCWVTKCQSAGARTKWAAATTA